MARARRLFAVAAVLLVLSLLAGCSAGPGSAASPPSVAPLRISAAEAVRGTRVAQIDGRVSGRSWLKVNGDSITATGVTEGATSVMQTPRGDEAVVQLSVAEPVGVVTLYHVVPLYVPASATVTLDGRPVDPRALTDIQSEAAQSLSWGFVSAVFTLDGERPTVRSLAVRSADGTTLAGIPLSGPAAGILKAPPADASVPWISIRSGEATSVQAYFGGSVGEGDTGTPDAWWQYYFVLDRLGSATIYHAIPLKAAPGVLKEPEPLKPAELRITLNGSLFVPVK